MTGNEVHRLEIVLTRIEGEVKAIRDENAEGKLQHIDFETRLRGLERVRWLVAGACTVLGSGIGAAAARILG